MTIVSQSGRVQFIGNLGGTYQKKKPRGVEPKVLMAGYKLELGVDLYNVKGKLRYAKFEADRTDGEPNFARPNYVVQLGNK